MLDMIEPFLYYLEKSSNSLRRLYVDKEEIQCLNPVISQLGRGIRH